MSNKKPQEKNKKKRHINKIKKEANTKVKMTKDQELVEKLKPCPFILVEKDIGHNPYVIETDEGWHIQCTCGARSPLSPVKEYAIKNWNCRQHFRTATLIENTHPVQNEKALVEEIYQLGISRKASKAVRSLCRQYYRTATLDEVRKIIQRHYTNDGDERTLLETIDNLRGESKSITAYQRANQLAASELDVLYGVTGIAVKKSPAVKRKVATKTAARKKRA